jgi:hypothetical protein
MEVEIDDGEPTLTKKQTRTIGTTSLDVRTIFERLKKMEFNETISYQELCDLTGRDIITHRHILVSARKMALRENIAFDVITNWGLKRLTDSDVVAIGSVRPLTKTRSICKNGTQFLNCAKDISNEERIRVNTSLSLLGTIQLFSAPKAVSKIIKAQSKVNYGELSFDKLVAIFDPQNKLQKLENQDTTRHDETRRD